jgi:apolipoprotein N-acyltransferase
MPPHPASALAESGPRPGWWARLRAKLAGLRGWRAGMAAAGLGLVSALALPPVYALPVLLLTVPGLLVLLEAQPGPRGAAYTGFWFGFGHHLLGLYWITEAILVEAARFWWLVPLAVPALAVVLALFIAAPCAAARAAPAGWRRVMVLAGAWVLADLARQFIATGFPWNPWGSIWAIPGPMGDAFLQPAALVGVHGLTLLTLLIAATPMLGARAMAGGVVVLAAWGGFGLWRLSQPAPASPDVTVVIVQGNVPQGQKWDQAFVTGTFLRYLNLTANGIAQARAEYPGQRVVAVWPETASPYLIDADVNARTAVAQAGSGATVLAGSVRFDADRRPRNSLMAVQDPGAPVSVYDKWHLVPFGEYQPNWLPLPIQVVPGGGFAKGPGPRTMHLPGLPPAGALICYEAIFPGQVVDATDRPDWLVNVTNDAWFGNSTGPRQHLAAARLRAVEEGLPLLRAANTGISAAFDAFGRERSRIGMGQTGVMITPLPGKLPPTPFARFGLALPALLAIVAVGAGIAVRRGISERE